MMQSRSLQPGQACREAESWYFLQVYLLYPFLLGMAESGKSHTGYMSLCFGSASHHPPFLPVFSLLSFVKFMWGRVAVLGGVNATLNRVTEKV